MIKRDGVSVVSDNKSLLQNALANKNGKVKVARENLQIIEDEFYIKNDVKIDISGQLAECTYCTKYFDKVEIDEKSNIDCKIEVTNETSTIAARRLMAEGKTNLVALNFANASNPGGGWLHGAQAQEEDLARQSALVASLKRKPQFYNNNVLSGNDYYTDGVIYSPFVPFFRDEKLELLDEPYYLSIITCPAPNLTMINMKEDLDQDKLEATLSNRIGTILQVAENMGHKNIILGAWGCGVFGNDSHLVSSLFKQHLKSRNFDSVCFAVYDTRENTPLFNEFKLTFN
jgi:uncharacterized protein (TIGR02452 family)